MQRQARRAGGTRRTARGLRPTPSLSPEVPEAFLSRLDRWTEPKDVEQIEHFTMTGHLTGERLA